MSRSPSTARYYRSRGSTVPTVRGKVFFGGAQDASILAHDAKTKKLKSPKTSKNDEFVEGGMVIISHICDLTTGYIAPSGLGRLERGLPELKLAWPAQK